LETAGSGVEALTVAVFVMVRAGPCTLTTIDTVAEPGDATVPRDAVTVLPLAPQVP